MKFSDLKKQMQKAINQAAEEAKQPSNMRKLGQMVADMVRLRTRLGYGVRDTGRPRQRLKPLSEGYRAQRKRGDLAGETSANKSNLTRKGKLLDSLDVTKVDHGRVEIGPTGSRNREVAKHVSEERPFLNLSNTEEKRITDQSKELVTKLLGTILTKLK